MMQHEREREELSNFKENKRAREREGNYVIEVESNVKEESSKIKR